MATGSNSIPQHPTFQNVVGYLHKFHLNIMEQQSPISCSRIWFIRAAVRCRHASTRRKLKRERWASREAQGHGFKQGTNIPSPSRLWLLSPRLCRGKQDSIPKGEQPGRAEPCTAGCLLEQVGARDREVCNDSSEHLLSVPPTFSSLTAPPNPPPPLFVICETADILPWALWPELKTGSKPKGVDTLFCQRSNPFLPKNLKKKK